jgi:acetyl esterase/lipase
VILSRRSALGALGAMALAACARSTSTTRPPGSPQRIAYGRDASQYADLYLPAPGVARKPGTAVIIHGGFWQATYGLDLGAPLAADLAARGWAAWNLEYRRLGNGGGWPQTFQDIAAGIDALADAPPDAALDLARVTAIGHSAGGQLAVWAAGRALLPAQAPGARPRVALTSVVSQAGVLDLSRAARESVGGTAATSLMGGRPEAVPERYAVGDPQLRLPLAVPVLCLHSPSDSNVPFNQSADYVGAAVAAGAQATLRTTSGDHFSLIDPQSADWAIVVDALPGLLG